MALLENTPILALRDIYDIQLAVETGTWRGDGARWLSKHFSQVWTIDVNGKLFEGDKPENLIRIAGQSYVHLSNVLDPTRKYILYLDAHWNAGMGDERPTVECALWDELIVVRAIAQQGCGAYIIIDDARYFISPRSEPLHTPAQWPTLNDIHTLLPDGYVTLIYNNVITAVPRHAVDTVQAWAAKTNADYPGF